MAPLRRTVRRMDRRAFTLTEIAAGLVILGVIAGFAVVGFQQVVARTQDVGPAFLVQQAAASVQFSYESRGVFPANAVQAAAIDGTVPWVAGPADDGEVSYASGSVDGTPFAVAVTRSADTCFGRVAGRMERAGQGLDLNGSWSHDEMPCDAQVVASLVEEGNG
jgi:prepilin-type N-terminal cleavage/methylation domain-containing protein